MEIVKNRVAACASDILDIQGDGLEKSNLLIVEFGNVPLEYYGIGAEAELEIQTVRRLICRHRLVCNNQIG